MSDADLSALARTTSALRLADDQATYWQSFAVRFDFPVCFTRRLFDPENPAFVDTLCRLEQDKRHRVLVFVDDGLAAAQPDLVSRITDFCTSHCEAIELVCAPILVPGGERIKADLHFVESMQRTLAGYHIDRHSYCVAVGGGAVLDAVGLVAATTHRGVRHIRVPTTVLSQNDSGVGVKNGVNQFGQKNFVGTFAPPFAVLNDLDFILALPDREKVAGMAEAVKVALIRDEEFFHWLERNADALASFEPDAMAYMIRRCAELHMRQIGQGGDPFETGSARPLDYGHWSAHKIESLTNYHVRHGEAVAIGIALDARYSVLAGLLEPGLDDRISFLLENLGFKLWHPVIEKRDLSGDLAVFRGIKDFQEHLGGELTVTVLNGIGVGIEVHEINERTMAEAVDWLKQRQADRANR